MGSNGMTSYDDEQNLHLISSEPRQARRRWGRLPLAIPVFVRGKDERGSGFVELTTAFNINPGGMLLATPVELPCEGHLDLEIPYAMPNRPPDGVQFSRYLRARIVHTSSSNGVRLYGLALLSPLRRDDGDWGPVCAGEGV